MHGAAVCLWISAGVAVIGTGAYLIGLLESPDILNTTIVGLVTAALLGLIAAKIDAGRNWARWLFVVVYVFGSLYTSFVLLLLAPQAFRSLPLVMQGSALVQFVLQTTALVLLFTSASRQWFKAKRA